MAKEELLEEELNDEELEDENENESGNDTPASSQPSPKEIITTECTRIINQYIEIAKTNNDECFIKALDNKDKTTESCINHIMNNLTKNRIYGGADSLMYEYIHEYYVDDFTEIKDEWSTKLSAGGSTAPAKKLSDKEIAKKYKALSEEEKKKIYEEQYKKAESEAKIKAQEALKKQEEKRKAKEKELAEKKKAEEQAKKEAERKAKEEALKNGAREQVSLFDLL